MTRWNFHDAEARLSELVRKTTVGLQAIYTSQEASRCRDLIQTVRQTTGRSKKPSLLDLLLNSPLKGLDIDFQRDRSPHRSDCEF